MRISAKLKQDLIKYNLNFPTDGRAKDKGRRKHLKRKAASWR